MRTNSAVLAFLWISVQLSGIGCRRNRNRHDKVPTSTQDTPHDWCEPCELSHCPVVTPDSCIGGNIVKDWCDCCPICINNPDSQSPTKNTSTTKPTGNKTDQSEACVKINCTKYEVCMLNIQGIPMCRCPTKFWCMKGERSTLCGQNDVTYKSKCFLMMAECESGKNIQIKHKGRCLRSAEDRKIKMERQKQKELKEKQKQEKKKQRMEKLERKMKKGEKNEKRERRDRKKQRRRSKNKRWTQKNRAL